MNTVTGPTYPDPPPPRPEPGPPTPRATFPYPDPPGGPQPDPNGPPPPKRPARHLVDHGWKLEVFDDQSARVAAAQVNDAGLWDIQLRPGGPVFVSDREEAETCLRALAVTS